MSLVALANEMASKGRNGDSMLVHMTPGEVQALQALAQRHGGTLTINPETGQPEANFLKKLLPAIAGAALNFFAPGFGSAIAGSLGLGGVAGATAIGTGIGVGGITALATGSLSRGLMAGLGAYGGASFAGGLENLGATAVAPEALAAANAAPDPIMALANAKEAATAAGATVPTGLEAAKQGLSTAAQNPKAFINTLGGPSKALTTAYMAATPIMAADTVQTTTPRPGDQTPSYIRPFVVNPYTQEMLALDPIDASKVRRKSEDGMADGGIVALANGGSPAREGVDAFQIGTGQDAAATEYLKDNPDVAAWMSSQEGKDWAAQNQAYDPSDIAWTHYVKYGAGEGREWGAPPPKTTTTPTYTGGDTDSAGGAASGWNATTPATYAPTGTTNPYGNGVTPGDLTFNADGSTTVTPNIPGRPYGGFTGIAQVKDAYTEGGGSLGQDNLFVPTTVAEMEDRYRTTGGSKQAYDYLSGKTGADVKKPITKTGELMLPYFQAMGLQDNRRFVMPRTTTSSAAGGLQALASGGAVRMADGGVSDQAVDAFFRGNPAATDAYIAAQMQRFNVSPEQVSRVTGTAMPEVQQRYDTAAPTVADAQEKISNIYQNVLGRDVDPSGLAYWTERLTQGGTSGQDMYNQFLLGALANKEMVRSGISLDEAVKPYTGYTSAESRNIADEWVRNTLGREVTAADRQTDWYKQAQDAATMNTYGAAQNIFSDFEDYARQTGGKDFTDLDLIAASQLLAPTTKVKPKTPYTGGNMNMPGGAADGWSATTPATYAPPGTRNPYGNGVTPGDLTFNPDGSITVQPNIPGRPYGGFTGIQQVKDAYTAGGGSLGQDNLFVPQTVGDMYQRYGTTGGSEQAYNYLMGKGAADVKKPITKTGELMLPYAEAMGLRQTNRFTMPKKPVKKEGAATAPTQEEVLGGASGGVMRMALGGLGALAGGGSTYNLGGYSDGGRLLRGPGDGVSDSIPATIGDKQPARLADGEFVVPARIVSELGNGSTEAGARKLYAMMDRVQKARGKTTGKGKVAKNTNADKYLPA